MSDPRRALVVICLSCFGWAFSFGVCGPLASLWLHDAGCSDAVIGWNGGVHYLGIALAALAVPALMRRWATRCPVAGMVLSGVGVAVFPWTDSLVVWFLLRILHGVGGAMSLIPLETYVNRDLPPQHRARNFGCYAVALTLGYVAGNESWIQLYELSPYLAFAGGGLAALLAAAVLDWFLPPVPSVAESLGGSRPDLRGQFLSYGSAWAQGFLEAGMVVFLMLYLLSLSMTKEDAGWVINCTMVGIIAVQVPIAWLADRLGRQRVLLGCYAVTLAGMIVLPFCGPGVWLTIWLFVVGAGSSAFYPLGLALLGDRLPESRIAQANAWYLMLECLGSWNGSVCMGYARDVGGPAAMFTAGALCVAVVPVAWWGVRRFGTRKVLQTIESHREAA